MTAKPFVFTFGTPSFLQTHLRLGTPFDDRQKKRCKGYLYLLFNLSGNIDYLKERAVEAMVSKGSGGRMEKRLAQARRDLKAIMR